MKGGELVLLEAITISVFMNMDLSFEADHLAFPIGLISYLRLYLHRVVAATDRGAVGWKTCHS